MDAKSEQVLLESLDRGLLTLTLNRPERRNCLDNEVVLELERLVHEVRDDRETRALSGVLCDRTLGIETKSQFNPQASTGALPVVMFFPLRIAV